MEKPNSIQILDWAILAYEVAWKKQQELVEERIKNNIPDTLIIVEHPPVITFGKGSEERKKIQEEALATIKDIPIYAVERGGEATYHGPGQIVVYPIFCLPSALGPKHFLRVLEESIIQTLKAYNIEAFRIKDATGVWVWDTEKKERKIASLGIALRNSVSYHGLALNLTTNLDDFQAIAPCGFAPQVMINVEDFHHREKITARRKKIESLLVKNVLRLYGEAKKDPLSFLNLPCKAIENLNNKNNFRNNFLGTV